MTLTHISVLSWLFSFFSVCLVSLSSFAICIIPANTLSTNTLVNSSVQFLEKNRKECLSKSRFLVEAPDFKENNFEYLLANPEIKDFKVLNGDRVYCRFHFQEQNGDSSKFRCVQTTKHNLLLDSKGELIPEAVSVADINEEVYLVDANGNRIPNLDKKGNANGYKEANLLKVRYYNGKSRNVENFVSVAASRILWTLGVPTHTNLMTDWVLCYGCGKDPFRQKKPTTNVFSSDQTPSELASSFPFGRHASIEFKFKGKRIYKPTETPWSWSELNQLYMTSEASKKIEMEVLALASHFLGYTSDNSLQHAIVCTKKDDSNPSVCLESLAMVHDIGAAFGDRAKSVLGGAQPRGDIAAFEKARIFKVKSSQPTCTFNYSDKSGKLPSHITAAGRDEFLRRAQGLTTENLKIIFSASHIGYLQKKADAAKVASLEERWVHAVEAKLEEIKSAPCP